MVWLAQVAISNAVVAIPLAGLAWLMSGICRRPAVTHTLWTLVLVKLLTPPLVTVPLPVVLEGPVAAHSTAEPVESPEHQLADIPADNLLIASRRSPKSGERRPALSRSIDVAPSAATTYLPAERVASSKSFMPRISIPRAWVQWIAPRWAQVGLIALCGVWIAGAVWFLCQNLWRVSSFRKLTAVLEDDAAMTEELQGVALALGIPNPPRIVLLDAVCTPMLWGIGPWLTIVFPKPLWNSLTRSQRATLLAHELAHFGRGDHWVRLLELVTGILFWWHPVHRWAAREIELAEEECCDSWVVDSLASTPRTYAEALLAALDYISEGTIQRPAVSTGVSQMPVLQQRLRHILDKTGMHAHSNMGLMIVGFICLFLVPLHPIVDVAAPNANAARLPGLPADAIFAMNDLTPATPNQIPQPARSGSVARNALERISEFVKLGSTEQQRVPQPVSSKRTPIQELAEVVSPDASYRLLIQSDNQVVLENRVKRRRFDLSDAQIVAAAFHPKEDLLVTGSISGMISLWDCFTGQKLLDLGDYQHEISSVAVHPNGRLAISADSSGTLIKWDLSESSKVQSLSAEGPIIRARFTPSGARIIMATGSWPQQSVGSAVLLDTNSLEVITNISLPNAVSSLEAVGEAEVATASSDGIVTLTNMLTGESTTLGQVGQDVLISSAFCPSVSLLDDLFSSTTANSVEDAVNSL